MNIKNIFLSLIFIFLLPAIAMGEEKLLADNLRDEVVDSIASNWEDWEKVSLSGKFKMDGLPLSPSLKIYMERDSLIIISLRAPFVGEAGRMEITPDTILAVNKMKKTYVAESLNDILAYYPGTISDLQELILGRIILPGFGGLRDTEKENVEIYTDDFSEYSLIPSQRALLEGVSYGYLINQEFLPIVLLIIPEQDPNVNILLNYTYKKKGYDLEFIYESPTFNQDFRMELDNPDWEGKSIEPINLNGKYRRQNIAEFMRSF